MNRKSLLNTCKIKTERFFLRALLPSDVSQQYLNWMKDEVAKKYIVASSQKQSITSLRNYVKERIARDDCLFLGIFSIKGDCHIGNIKFEPINYNACFAEMGIFIGEADWRGKNVFQEVLTSASEWLYQSFGINEIRLGVELTNFSAIKAYEKVGFKRLIEDDPEFDYLHAIKMFWKVNF